MRVPPPNHRRLVLGLTGAALLLTGCGGYAGTSEAFRSALTSGRIEPALDEVNKALGVERAEQLPSEPDADTALLLLERGTILQALGRSKLSARDLQLADKSLDVLDLTSDTAGNIGKYLFSDDATVYKAPPYEKLLLNTVNMLNYLVLGDAQGAKVEARRLTINRKWLQEQEAGRAMLALSSYLAGFAFEVAGEPDPAMRHYADAHEAGGVPGLVDAARRLAASTGTRDARLDLGEVGERPPGDAEQAELLVVVQTGMAPYKIPKRLPIGAAVVVASNPGPGARLNSKQRNRANRFAAKGILKWVNYPSLRRVGRNWGRVSVQVDGRGVAHGVALDVERRVVEQHKRVKGTLIAASITRLISRAVAGEASQAVTKKASGSGIVGLLVGLAVEGALTAADTPDTRGWVTLPARFHVARARLPAGRHTVVVRYRGQLRQRTVDLSPGGWGLLNFSDLR